MVGRKMELLSLTCLGDDVMEKLKQYAQEDVVFIKENKSADAVLVYQFCREFMDWYYQCLKERQKTGIQNALKRKREGNGVYGCKLRLNGISVPHARNGYSIFSGTKYY